VASHETTVDRHDREYRVRPVCKQDDGSEYPAIGSETEEADDDREACLHYIASLVGRLPLDEERAVVKLKTRWLLGDVDVDRCPP
jgi:hypothetical protein